MNEAMLESILQIDSTIENIRLPGDDTMNKYARFFSIDSRGSKGILCLKNKYYDKPYIEKWFYDIISEVVSIEEYIGYYKDLVRSHNKIAICEYAPRFDIDILSYVNRRLSHLEVQLNTNTMIDDMRQSYITETIVDLAKYVDHECNSRDYKKHMMKMMYMLYIMKQIDIVNRSRVDLMFAILKCSIYCKKKRDEFCLLPICTILE